MWKMLGASLLALGVALPASAESVCNKRDSIVDALQRKYEESPVALGVTNSGGLIEVLTSGDGNTWSIIVTTPNGQSCLIAAGEGWRSRAPETVDPGV